MRHRITLALSFLFLTSISRAQTQPKPDADFPFQGEYADEIDMGKGPQKFGIQVIALGDAKFRAVFYPGGLPGDGWTKDKPKVKADGTRTDDTVTFAGSRLGGIIKNNVFTMTNVNGKEIGPLKKVERESPTIGAKPPQGAIILFDGKNADQWEKGKVTEDGLLMQGTQTKQKFGSGTLHIEFLLPYEPKERDQGRGNSGCYMQGRDEVQILDSFGLEGKNNECGAIYGIAEPIVNMCFPPMTWQTYDIEFTAAQWDGNKKVKNAIFNSVRHNGVLVHKDQEVTKVTTAAPVGDNPEPGPINLQNHGHEVRFRNIWFVPR
jgi:3-keto-disaccharide hydrolase